MSARSSVLFLSRSPRATTTALLRLQQQQQLKMMDPTNLRLPPLSYCCLYQQNIIQRQKQPNRLYNTCSTKSSHITTTNIPRIRTTVYCSDDYNKYHRSIPPLSERMVQLQNRYYSISHVNLDGVSSSEVTAATTSLLGSTALQFHNVLIVIKQTAYEEYSQVRYDGMHTKYH
jgi:hypothetical protein